MILGIVNSMSAESYASWGWRIPFLIAAPLSAIGLYIRHKTEESDAFIKAVEERGTQKKVSLRDSLRSSRLRMLQVFMIVSLNALTFYFMVGYFVTYLQTVVKLTQQESLISNAAGLLTFSILLPLCGRLSDRIGRKPMLLAGSLLIAVLSVPTFNLLTQHTLQSAILRNHSGRLSGSVRRWQLYFFRRTVPDLGPIHRRCHQLQHLLCRIWRYRTIRRHLSGQADRQSNGAGFLSGDLGGAGFRGRTDRTGNGKTRFEQTLTMLMRAVC